MSPKIRIGATVAIAAALAGCFGPEDRRPGMQLRGEVVSKGTISATEPVYRVMNLPPQLWAELKYLAATRRTAVRVLIAEALHEQLELLIQKLQNEGFPGEIRTRR